MTSGNITRSFGLSALVVMTAAGFSLTGAAAAHAQSTSIFTDAQGYVELTENGGSVTKTSATAYYLGANAPSSEAAATAHTAGNANSFVAGVPGYNYGSDSFGLNQPPYLIGDPGKTTDAQGYYDFAFTFGTTGSESLVLTGFADNVMETLYIDGVAATETAGPIKDGVASETYTANIVGASANHTFDLLVYNAAGSTGNPVAVAFSGTATPEPGVVVTGLSMLSMTGLGLVRGRRRAKGAKIAA